MSSTERTIDYGRLAVELSRVANHLHREGIGDGATAVDDANREVTRLRLEVERLRYTLTEIQSRDWWENALDPQWAARIARARLAGAFDEQRLACGWCVGEGAIRDPDGKLGEDCPRCHGASKLSPGSREEETGG